MNYLNLLTPYREQFHKPFPSLMLPLTSEIKALEIVSYSENVQFLHELPFYQKDAFMENSKSKLTLGVFIQSYSTFFPCYDITNCSYLLYS